LLKEGLPEVASEFGVSIRDDCFRQPMVFKDFTKEYFGDFWGCGCGMHWAEMGSLSEAVYKYYNGVMSFPGWWQLHDEIHGDFFPSVGWC